MRSIGMMLRSFHLLAAVSLAACTASYSARPITAIVVDAETGEPLEGVNVVAQWILHGPTWVSAGSLEVDEAVTDKDGRFHIPGWGPKEVPGDLPRGTRLGNAPKLTFFKGGYSVKNLGNELQPQRLRPDNDIPVRYSDWDGKVIKLERFKGSTQDYASSLRSATMFYFQDCKWVKFRRYLMAIFREADRLKALGVIYLPTYRSLAAALGNECGALEKIFAEYLK
jgi:hypothetical protein